MDGNGKNRQTGGGGSGSAQSWRSTNKGYTIAPRGGNGTSYSGGTGSGGIRIDASSNSNTYQSGIGSDIGGAGGNGNAAQGNSSNVYGGGGAGNPGGKGYHSTGGWNKIQNNSILGQNGTGGLMIIYSNEIYNAGIIESNGTNSLPITATAAKGSGGGASGGGSINIFVNSKIEGVENIRADGGTGGYLTTKGGAGGIGSISVGDISTGTYKSTYTNY